MLCEAIARAVNAESLLLTRSKDMLWQGRRQSSNVEDVRRSGGKGIAVGGGIGSVIFVVAYLLLGGDPQALVESMQQEQGGVASTQVEGRGWRRAAR